MKRTVSTIALLAGLALLLGWWFTTRVHDRPPIAAAASIATATDASDPVRSPKAQAPAVQAPPAADQATIAWDYDDILLEISVRYGRFATERGLMPEQAATLFDLLAERHYAALHGAPPRTETLSAEETARLLAQLLGREAAAELDAYDRAFTQETSAREGLDRLYAVGPIDERAARALYHELLHWDFDRDLALVVDRGQPITPGVRRNLEQEHFVRLQSLLARVGAGLSPEHRNELYQWSSDRFASRLQGARAQVARSADAH